MRLVLLLSCLVAALSCTKATQPAFAFKVASRGDLVGGQRALGEVGDFKLQNGLIQAIVQDVGTSRGFGAFGGSLIDLDLVRGLPSNTTQGPTGDDYFTEMFPAFFLLAIEPSKVEVLNDGTDGNAATIRVSGDGGDFISIVASINDLLIPQQHLTYHVDYSLAPGNYYLTATTTVTNEDTQPAGFPLAIPFGFVTLLGEGERLFLPNEAGYDVRFHLDQVYARDSGIEALPGEVVSMIATEGPGVSYAVAAAPKGAGYMTSNPGYYLQYGLKPDSLLVPIASSSFLGTFWGKPPAVINPGNSYSYTGYVAVGGGDVTSVQKVIWNIDDPTGGRKPFAYATISGHVRENTTLTQMVGTSVVLQDDQGRYASQARTIAGGIYTAVVPPGNYRAFAVDSVRDNAVGPESGYVTVAAGDNAVIDINMNPAAVLQVTVRDDTGRAIPAKISVEGIYSHTGLEPARDFFYSLPLGESFRNTDLIADSDDPETRRYLETFFFITNGAGGKIIRPGSYKVYASRGIEYSLASADVVLTANKTTSVALVLKQEMPTPGWASGDFHVHSINSVDSSMALEERVTSYAVEGVDLVTSTDHNFVTDLQPTIDNLYLSDWVHSSIGLELTTLEMGHFNGYPISVQPGPVTHGSFAWFMRPPGDLFAQLRGLGVDQQNTIVQVNHPRDSVLGYFTEFSMGAQTSTPYKGGSFTLDTRPLPDGGLSPYDPSNFSLDFDALEVFNGKRDMILYTYRNLADAGPGPDPTVPNCSDAGQPDCIPAPGELELTKVTTLDGGSMITTAFPGALDDWYALLGHGYRFTATGNSDSHSNQAEAGLPRTYMNVGPSADGSMRGLSESACMQALKKGQATVTNGPFIEAWVNDVPIGGTAVIPDGNIKVHVKVQAASWVDITGVRIKRGGPDAITPQVLADIPVTASTDILRIETTLPFSGVPDHSYIVVEAYGQREMWPVFTPYEIAAIQISDAVAVIGGSFGYTNQWGRYKPQPINIVRPFGFTNPIYLSYTDAAPLTAAKRVLPLSASEPFHPRTLTNLWKLYGAFHSDPH